MHAYFNIKWTPIAIFHVTTVHSVLNVHLCLCLLTQNDDLSDKKECSDHKWPVAPRYMEEAISWVILKYTALSPVIFFDPYLHLDVDGQLRLGKHESLSEVASWLPKASLAAWVPVATKIDLAAALLELDKLQTQAGLLKVEWACTEPLCNTETVWWHYVIKANTYDPHVSIH